MGSAGIHGDLLQLLAPADTLGVGPSQGRVFQDVLGCFRVFLGVLGCFRLFQCV